MLKTYLMSLKSVGLLAMFTAMLASCATGGDVWVRNNLGEYIMARLQVGMSSSDVDLAIANVKKYVWEDSVKAVESDTDVYALYKDNYYPKDFLESVDVGTQFRVLAYWTNYAGRDAGTLRLFFDERSHRLRGWVNTATLYSRDKFMHERLTSQLRTSEGGSKKGMSHAQVHALIGEPVEIISSWKRSRALYADRFWAFGGPPFQDQKIEVYRYPIDGGERRVFLVYYRNADRLYDWGYDHAWDEAARYGREHAALKNN
jgi:hypothetical protein